MKNFEIIKILIDNIDEIENSNALKNILYSITINELKTVSLYFESKIDSFIEKKIIETDTNFIDDYRFTEISNYKDICKVRKTFEYIDKLNVWIVLHECLNSCKDFTKDVFVDKSNSHYKFAKKLYNIYAKM